MKNQKYEGDPRPNEDKLHIIKVNGEHGQKEDVMSDDFKRFVESIKSPNTAKVARSLHALGDYDYSDCTLERVQEILLNMKPNSPRAITSICYILKLYAKFMGNEKLYQITLEVDRNSLWLKAKPEAGKKFISHSEFMEVYHDVGVYEDFNGFYKQTLFRCLYEGIYNDDMSVLKNLRASDVHGHAVALRDDSGNAYELEISGELASDLIEMGSVNSWGRKNRFSSLEAETTGLYPDSCFKTEIRKDGSEYSYRYAYYRILREIAKNYVGHSLSPLQIYVSGIVYRIELKLSEHDISLAEAFAMGNKNKLVSQIIGDELERCHYNAPVRNFREMVCGRLEDFIGT